MTGRTGAPLSYPAIWLAITVCVTRAEYFGTLIGQLSNTIHDVAGDVHVADASTLIVNNFNYDGSAPDAHFLVGVSGQHGSQPEGSGLKLIPRNEINAPLEKYTNKRVILDLPDGKTVSDLTWLSVYCIKFGVDFGHVVFPRSPAVTPPVQTSIGQISELAHGVRSGDIIVKDAKTFLINDLHYDGQGPDAFFLVGTGMTVSATGATKVPDENGSLEKLGGYDGQDVTIQLPADLTVFDIDWLSMYCIRYAHNFGDVFLPETLNVPPHMDSVVSSESLADCEELDSFIQVSWEIRGDAIIMELVGSIAVGGWMAFGLSGSDERSAMGGADVAVVSVHHNGSITTEDYFLSSYGQCTGSNGVCSDVSQGGKDDLTVIQSSMEDGFVRSKFSRPLNTGDSSSTDIALDPSKEMYIVWATGPLTSDGVVTKHDTRLTGDAKIAFGRNNARTCSNLVVVSQTQAEPWKPHKISDVNEFVAQIGPAGQSQGYQGLTGIQSWGIVWYMNSVLAPELVLQRNMTYTFRVSGGRNSSMPAKYHPFYITDDPEGGYFQKTQAQRREHTVYAGIDPNTGQPSNEAVGRLCEWKTTKLTPDNGYPTFDDFAATLRLDCESEGSDGLLTWTPDESTPDLVYYQCYTHPHFGWKIHVTDSAPSIGKITHLLAMLMFAAYVYV